MYTFSVNTRWNSWNKCFGVCWHLLEDGLGGQHGAVDLQDLLLLDEVLPPGLQDVVLQGAAHRAEVIQAAHT